MTDDLSSPRRRVTLGQHCGDFANVFKAFIGGNYLSVSFGLSQSGFTLGILGLIFIAALTDHCCHLIVKCKRSVVGKVVADYASATGLSEHDDNVQEVRRNVENKLSYGDIGRFCYGKLGLFIVDLSLLITQFLFCVSYCIFIGNAIHTIAFGKHNSTSSSPAPTASSSSRGPPLEVLVLAALPVFMAFSFIHSVRKLSALSTVANVAIFGGFFSILVYMIVGFRPASDGIEWFAKWETFPVFFGQMTSAYEGIGLIIPIESSMDGNRQYFSPFLHASLLLLTCLFAVFGGLGYIRHGSATAQTINLNIYPQDGTLAIVVNITLIVGIIFTFPLQFYPVAEILESWIFGNGCPKATNCCRRSRANYSSATESEDDLAAIDSPSEFSPIMLSAGSSSHVASWKRSVMRILLVLLAGALGVAFRQVFAYLIAFTGAIGCTMLAFILPCVFHIKLEKMHISKWVVAKNIFIIVISTIGGGASLYITIREIIRNLSYSELTL